MKHVPLIILLCISVYGFSRDPFETCHASWTEPTEREDDSKLDPKDIIGYPLYVNGVYDGLIFNGTERSWRRTQCPRDCEIQLKTIAWTMVDGERLKVAGQLSKKQVCL